LVESFVLNSEDREVSRKGKGRSPDPSFKRNGELVQQLFLLSKQSGRKVKDIDLNLLTSHFANYVKVVNLILSRIYMTDKRAQSLGKALSEYRGRAYTLLRKEKDLCYQHNNDFKELLYERLHRNALEHAGRTLHADYTRRALFTSAIKVLTDSSDDVLNLLRRKRIPSDLIRRVRDSCEFVKNNGSGYHYTLGVLRQVCLALDLYLLDSIGLKIGWRGRQRKKVSSLLKEDSPDCQQVKALIEKDLRKWKSKGYPFTVPQLRSYSLDFSASTENATGQGYWFTLDPDRENEILLHLKLPPGIDGTHPDASPYRGKTLTFRFLDWLPRAASEGSEKVKRAEEIEDFPRAERLRFRAAMFEDMHTQLRNTIELQHLTHRLTKLRQKRESDEEETAVLETRVKELKTARRSAPPRLLLRDGRVILQVPFLSPNGEVSTKILGAREYDNRAGVDRGLRVPVVLSVQKKQEYTDLLLRVEHLIAKRECLRKHAYQLQSITDRKKNNWERKRKGLSYPGYILKKERHITALWRKVRRLDREVARVIASKTVWFCEEHRVKTLFFEDLRSFQGHAGSKDLSYNLSSNLWGNIIDTVRYMREALGHSKYSVWTVNPRYTSQTCHACGERGIRVEDESSTKKKKGGEYFYCRECEEHFHADVNAARNIIHVHPGPSVVSGRTA
ncbi:MAG: hypothetical protein E4H14_16895, partial [Candidatus Thorarchaeota archaeon]